MAYDAVEPMGNQPIIWMIATLCSVIANVSQDADGKMFVYRRNTGHSLQARARPDPTMMRPEDFLKGIYGAVDDEKPGGHQGMTDEEANQMVRELFPNAVDLRKQRRDGPRTT